MADHWTRDELKAALQAYDLAYGPYPEHVYEGHAVWLWLTDRREMDRQERDRLKAAWMADAGLDENA